MGLMEGVQKIGGVWKIRRRIPADCAAAFGVKEFYTRTLGTSDRKLAMQLAAPLLAEIDQRIVAIRAGASGEALSNAPKAFLPMDRQRAFEAIASWRRLTIQAASEQGWSGLLPPLDNDEAVRLSGIRMVLRTGGLPNGFDDHMAGALGVPVEHPICGVPNSAKPFGLRGRMSRIASTNSAMTGSTAGLNTKNRHSLPLHHWPVVSPS